MKTSSFLHLLSLFLALKTTHESTVVKNATYDDIQTLSGSIPLTTYDNLIYNLVNVTRARPLAGFAGPGVLTASSPNCAISSAQQSGVIGTPFSSPSSFASFNVAPPYKSLKLLDFYYGCVYRSASGFNPADGAAVRCTVTVTGFNTYFGSTEPASFTFSPLEGSLMPSSMNHAVLPATFQQQGLVNFTLTQDNSMAVVLLDNLRYSVST